MSGLPRRPGPSVRARVTEHRAERAREREDRLATEEPLEIRVGWAGVAAQRMWVTMRTPGHDFELAAGWVRHEGVAERVRGVAYCTDVTLDREQELNVVTVTLAEPPNRAPAARHPARSSGSSACGVCGKDSVAESLLVADGDRWDGPLPSQETIRELPRRLRDSQPLFDRTGAVHAAGLATHDGELVVVREDIGRHNAVDKVTGARMLAGLPTAEACLVISGRAGFEIVQKAIVAGIGCLVAVGPPTSLSVRLAQQAGISLFGFTSADRTVRYC